MRFGKDLNGTAPGGVFYHLGSHVEYGSRASYRNCDELFYSGFLQLSPFFLQLEETPSNPDFRCSLWKHGFSTRRNTPKPVAKWCEARALTN
jgi:hypothetical protein